MEKYCQLSTDKNYFFSTCIAFHNNFCVFGKNAEKHEDKPEYTVQISCKCVI